MARHFPLRRAIALLMTGLVLAVGQSAVAISTGVLSDEKLAFTVTRNGKPIGSHVYKFARQDGQTIVDIQTNIDFRLLSLPVYRFQHKSHEIWDGERLIRLVSNTDDNGEPVTLDVRAEGSVLKVGGQDGTVEVDAKAVPASLWNPAVVKRERLLDTVSGALLTTKVTDLGDETLTVAGESRLVRRYRLSGDYHRELWYDRQAGTLVRVRFEAADGSDLEYVLTP